MTPRAFRTPLGFRTWIERHAGAREIQVRCFKTHASDLGMTYKQALDEALCVGWIDGVRFTPRREGSAWSAVNVRRAGELLAAGRMSEAGRLAFRARVASRYSFEAERRALAPAFLRRLRANGPAWRFFEAQPPWYRRSAAFWVTSARRPETRERRLALLIESSQQHQGIPPLRQAGRGPRGSRSPAKARSARRSR